MDTPEPSFPAVEALRKRVEEWEEREYKETGLVEYAAVAIGRHPKAPPACALKACREYALIQAKTLQRFDDQKELGRKDRDDRLMPFVTLGIAVGMTPKKAAEWVLELLDEHSETLESDRRRLSRLWRREQDLAAKQSRPNRWVRYVWDCLTTFEIEPPAE